MIGAQSGDAFAADWLGTTASTTADATAAPRPDGGTALAPRACSRRDGWFWDDPVRTETRQVLRAAARAVRLVDALAGSGLERRLVEDLETIHSPSTGIDGAAIYRRALVEVGQPPPVEHRPAVR